MPRAALRDSRQDEALVPRAHSGGNRDFVSCLLARNTGIKPISLHRSAYRRPFICSFIHPPVNGGVFFYFSEMDLPSAE